MINLLSTEVWNLNNIDLKKVKLIIWDLDDTLGNGTISESSVELNKSFLKFIFDTLDAGIVHSICSKNDFNVAMSKLTEFGIGEVFIFPSINWEPKGMRIKQIINNMHLRAENVLFIDDNIQNLQEAAYYNNGLMTLTPKQINYLLVTSIDKNDLEHKRFNQYKILEAKRSKQEQFANNEDFLCSCHITVNVYSDCLKHIDRLYELLMRSNQLNYTKNRQSKDKFIALLNDSEVSCGYVTVRDDFGDYGIVGFYAIKNGEAIHFLFSCRTLGMLVEQYVYMYLGCPTINVIGDVATQLNKEHIPHWINQTLDITDKLVKNNKSGIYRTVLLKGPCDISQIFSFIQEDKKYITTEFTYTNDNGFSIEGHNHMAQIASSLKMSDAQKMLITSEFIWLDKQMYDTALANKTYDYVVLSMVVDASLGLYKRKATGEYLAYYSRAYDITDTNNWMRFLKDILKPTGCQYDTGDLERFRSTYEHVDNESFAITIESLSTIWAHLDSKKTKLILLLPSEIKYPGKTRASYLGRELVHKNLNQVVRAWARDKENVILLPIDQYITDEHCFLDTINHFTKIVYYRMARDLIKLFKDNNNDTTIRLKGKYALVFSTLWQKIVSIYHKIKY